MAVSRDKISYLCVQAARKEWSTPAIFWSKRSSTGNTGSGFSYTSNHVPRTEPDTFPCQTVPDVKQSSRVIRQRTLCLTYKYLSGPNLPENCANIQTYSGVCKFYVFVFVRCCLFSGTIFKCHQQFRMICLIKSF